MFDSFKRPKFHFWWKFINIFSYLRNCIIRTSVQNQHKCVVFSWKHALLWNSWWCYRKRNSTSVKRKWPRMKKKTSEAPFSLGKVEKNVRVFDRACSWTLVERLGQKGEQTTDDGEKEQGEWGGKKAKREIQLAIFYTSIFAVITTCG